MHRSAYPASNKYKTVHLTYESKYYPVSKTGASYSGVLTSAQLELFGSEGSCT